MTRTLFLSIVIASGVASLAFAGEPQPVPCFPRQANLCCTCPDSYCPKPLPMLACPPKCCADDYCPKPLPSVCFKTRVCVDDYCPKPFPKIFVCCPPPSCH